jgi:hypothetical protein
MGFQNFATHFWDEVLSQDMAHINDLPVLGYAHVALGILSSSVVHRLSYFTRMVLFFSSRLFWHFLTRELCMYVGTLWVQDHGSLFKPLQQGVKFNYRYLLVV